jgi:plasmid stabilization system protein ParE
MRRLEIKARARLDLIEIRMHIASESETTATAVMARLDAAIKNLLLMPGMGHTHQEVANGRIRFWNVDTFLITYRYDDASLTILRIIRGKRNLKRMHRRGEMN